MTADENRAMRLIASCKCRSEGMPENNTIPPELFRMIADKQVSVTFCVEALRELGISEREFKRQRTASK